MRGMRVVAVAVSCLFLSSACITPRSVRENRRISRLIRKDLIDFYENMSQAYYVLGLGYYRLHKIAMTRDDLEAAKQYQSDAIMYKKFSEDLKAVVEAWRKDYNVPVEAEMEADPTGPTKVVPAPVDIPMPPESPDLDVPAAPDDVPSEGASNAEPSPPSSILDGLQFWRKKQT